MKLPLAGLWALILAVPSWSGESFYRLGREKVEMRLVVLSSGASAAGERDWQVLPDPEGPGLFASKRAVFVSEDIDFLGVAQPSAGRKGRYVTCYLKEKAWEKALDITSKYHEAFPAGPVASRPKVALIKNGELAVGGNLLSPMFGHSGSVAYMTRLDDARFLKGMTPITGEVDKRESAVTAWLERRAKARPDDWGARMELAFRYAARNGKGDLRRAAFIWEAILDQRPSRQQVPLERGQVLEMLRSCYLGSRQYERAAIRFRRELASGPNEMEGIALRLLLTEALVKGGAAASARKELEAARARLESGGLSEGFKADMEEDFAALEKAIEK